MEFYSGGLLGDFIHQLFVVKNYCEKTNEKADLYLSDNIGDKFSFGIEKAYTDLYDLVISQPYINSFSIKNYEIGFNLSSWRHYYLSNGIDKSWTELMSSIYSIEIQNDYKWISINNKLDELKNTTLLHSSNRRRNPKFDYDAFIKENENIAFLIGHESDLYIEGYDKYEPTTISEMALYINSCKLFVGNQSSPFAIANALDVPRLGILDLDYNNYVFYKNEEKYSNNIQTFF